MEATRWQRARTIEKKLEERLDNPRVPAAALSGMADCYKIKLRQIGYRLVYRVDDDVVFVTVIGVGKRDKQKVYEAAQSRLRPDAANRKI